MSNDPATSDADVSGSSTPPHEPIKPEITFDDFMKLDLRVATILEAEPIPKADKLIKLQVDLGSEQRQICAGIKEHYTPESLVGRQIVVVCNLAPRKIRGEVSNGMLLAATHQPDAETTHVVLLQPGSDVRPGSAVG